MKPVPWFWITRVALSTAAVVVWAIAYPHTPVWELVLVSAGAILTLEGLRYGYRQEQADIRKRRQEKS